MIYSTEAAVPLARRPGTLSLCVSIISSVFGGLILSACPGPGFTADKPDIGVGGNGGAACEDSPLANPNVVSNNCAIFVAPDGDDKTGSGTRESPFGSLAKAVGIAKTGKKRVFACSGDYTGTATLTPGVELYGGRDCKAGWERTDQKTVLRGNPGDVPLRLLGGAAAGSAAITRIDNVRFEAADAEALSGSSIAAIAEDGAVIELSACDLIAGAGAEGAPGANAPGDVPSMPMLMTENAGVAACTNQMGDMTNLGGLEHVNPCNQAGDVFSLGGMGGDGAKLSGKDGEPGRPMLMGGAGGLKNMPCLPGQGAGSDGSDGAPGAPGAKGAGDGMLSPLKGWLGAPGGDGGKGSPGQGGGGGAGQTGNATCGGASGGSGGAGGCGGEGGKGGAAGGSSIALVSINATITINGGVLQAGNGGNGGSGGKAQTGGTGSDGAPGGLEMQGLAAGCKGGRGGFGGGGGQGGGGTGGHSLAIAFSGTLPSGDFMSTFGAAGSGGKGGLDTEDNAGEDGKVGDSLKITMIASN